MQNWDMKLHKTVAIATILAPAKQGSPLQFAAQICAFRNPIWADAGGHDKIIQQCIVAHLIGYRVGLNIWSQNTPVERAPPAKLDVEDLLANNIDADGGEGGCKVLWDIHNASPGYGDRLADYHRGGRSRSIALASIDERRLLAPERALKLNFELRNHFLPLPAT
jgi:hypothetical protein